MENVHKLSGCRKEHADHFPVENGSNFQVESEHFPDTPMETLVMHPTNTEDARNGAGQSQMCRVLETPNTLCNRNMSFLLLGFLANFPEYFPEKSVMRNGFFFSEVLVIFKAPILSVPLSNHFWSQLLAKNARNQGKLSFWRLTPGLQRTAVSGPR